MSEKSPPRLMPLRCPLQHYAWGSIGALPKLLGLPEDGRPWAEFWMGAHPKSPSRFESRGLDAWVDDHALSMLGEPVAQRFGRLPFLFKILTANAPLSIQTHPNRQQALRGFNRENEQGLATDAFERSYKDASDKAELIVALSSFNVLCGFRTVDAIHQEITRRRLEALLPGQAWLAQKDLKGFFAWILNLEESAKARALSELRRSLGNRPLDAVLNSLLERYPQDSGVFAGLFLNFHTLSRGQALFLKPGILHAYLSGTALELMTSSDNVLRAGLTVKHVDQAELMKVGFFEAQGPKVVDVSDSQEGWRTYQTPADSFELVTRDFTGASPAAIFSAGPQILACLHGSLEVTAGSERVVATPSTPIYVRPGTQCEVSGEAECFVARVPASALQSV